MTTQPLSDNEFLFTSESVTEGHPDKMADQISDGVLDAVMAEDPTGRVACETLVNTGLVVVSGEISTETYVDIQDIARETIRKIGYTDADLGFSADSCAVINAIDKQSPDIAQGVDSASDAAGSAGAGDQGMDDGTICRLDDESFYVTTTSSGAGAVEQWFSWWLADWRMQVTLTDVTQGLAAVNLAGPRAREIMAKTHLSLSSDPELLNAPENFSLPVRDIRAYTGAGWLVPLCGDITQMPGLGKTPAALNVDIDENGRTVGLF